MEPFHFNSTIFLIRTFFTLSLFLNFLHLNCNAYANCSDEEKSALLQLKQGFISRQLDSWRSEIDCCIWNGVTCDESRRVIGLDISNRYISGRINPTLFNLTSLQSLDLSGNFFELEQIPDFGWSGLRNLSSLNLSHASFSGKVPIEIFHLAKMISLDLSDNEGLYLSADATILRNMSSLRELYLDFVNVSVYGDGWCGVLVNSTSLIEALSMRFCSLFGAGCSSLSKLPYLSFLNLGANNLDSGIMNSFVNLTLLSEIRLAENGFEGVFPNRILQLKKLKYFDISNNPMLSGSLPEFSEENSLENLYIYGTNFSGNIPDTIGNLKFLLALSFSGCQFSGRIPTSMKNLSQLELLDLSYNYFNDVVELDFIKNFKYLIILDLSNSGFSLSPWDADDGSLSAFFHNMSHLGLASCNLTKTPSFMKYQDHMRFLDLSNNRLTGEILPSFCNMTEIHKVDLSNNRLVGSIPPCFFESDLFFLQIINLSGNQLHGAIPQVNNPMCLLETIILSDNQLDGMLPRSLANCTMLDILDLGNNNINDTFPYWLVSKLSLKVLILRSNKFYGLVGPPHGNHEINHTFSSLHVLDISHNNFSGNLNEVHFNDFESMMVDTIEESDLYVNEVYFNKFLRSDDYDDLYVLTIINKAQVMQLQKFWILVKSIDFSNNHFEGEIPISISQLVFLKVLNLSHNYLKGEIPPQLRNLSQLESLDLSMNSLTGKIPRDLVALTSLSWLNLSYNKLVGQIPSGGQFSTFPNTSFEGNDGLCLFPCNTSIPAVNKTMAAPSSLGATTPKNKSYMIVLGILFGVGFGVSMAIVILIDLMFCDKSTRNRTSSGSLHR